jgi:peptidyl-prolyl cis-trans isomerase C
MSNKITFEVCHILVDAGYEAQDLLRKLQAGEDFSVLARKYSKCSSSVRGGELGLLKSGQSDPDFEEASLALKPGQTSSAALRTRFGYHLIKRIR